jgi:hypothetical protein
VPRVLQPAEQLAAIVSAGEAHIHQVRTAEVGVVDDVDNAGLGLPALPSPIRRMIRASNTAWCRRPAAQLALVDQRAGLLIVDAGRAVVGFRDTGEKADREKAMSIPLQTWPRLA